MKPRQAKLEGIEPAPNPEVEKAAEKLRGIRTQRLKMQESEKLAVTELKGALEKHHLTEYSYEAENEEGETKRFDVKIETKEKVFVRTHKEEDEEPEEDGEE